jgi:hypothetical protein
LTYGCRDEALLADFDERFHRTLREVFAAGRTEQEVQEILRNARATITGADEHDPAAG